MPLFSSDYAMHFKRFSPAITLLLLLFVLMSGLTKVQAGASNKNGNPYGNGTFFQTTGTFSAVVRGENLSGTVLFSTGANTNTSSNSSGGNSIIVYQGNTYAGNASGFWDPSSGAINGQIWGGQNLSGTNTTTIYPEIFNTNTFPVVVALQSNVIGSFQSNSIDPNTGATNTVTIPFVTVVTNLIALEPTGTNFVSDSVYMNGAFSGQTQNKYPNQTFSATGSVTQQQLAAPVTYNNQGTNGNLANTVEGTYPAQVSSVAIPITVQGIRVADNYSSFAAISNAVPYSTTYYTVTNPPQ